jgi:hemerythrin-like domain-containing protein
MVMRQQENISPENYAVDTEAPLTNFNHCHIGILHQMDRLSELPALLGPAMLAQKIATQAVDFFHRGMLAHHQEEERELFPAVQHSANIGEERLKVDQLIEHLVQEHRALEQLWEGLEPALKKVAKGQEAHLDTARLQTLVARYSAHAESEERVFLPLAEKILGRNSNHMAALGLSLHMRHAPRILSHI